MSKYFIALLMCAVPTYAQATAQEQSSRMVDETRVTYLFGSVLPKEAVWQPLTAEQRRKIYWKSSWANPGVVFRSLGTAALDQADNDPAEWQQGFAGYSRRFGSRFASYALQDAIQAGSAAALGYEVRYLRCRCEGFGNRFAYAAMQNFVTKNREGKWRANLPQWFGSLGGSAIAVYGWYPESTRNGNEILRNAAFQLAVPIVFNAIVEFGPEIKTAFLFWRR